MKYPIPMTGGAMSKTNDGNTASVQKSCMAQIALVDQAFLFHRGLHLRAHGDALIERFQRG